MTPDERNLLQQFLSDLEATRGAAKDPGADGLINGALRSNPDAAYLLVQHAIMADQALQAAQQQIEALEQRQGLANTPPAFLGGGQPAQPQAQGGDWNSPPTPQPQSPLSPKSGLNGFLRNAGMMAAGVAGGTFLAEGLSNLFSPRDW